MYPIRVGGGTKSWPLIGPPSPASAKVSCQEASKLENNKCFGIFYGFYAKVKMIDNKSFLKRIDILYWVMYICMHGECRANIVVAEFEVSRAGRNQVGPVRNLMKEGFTECRI